MLKKTINISVICLILVLFFVFTAQLSFAQEKINVMAHRVHKDVVVGSSGAGINIMPDLIKQEGIDVEWQTLPWEKMQELIYREASLKQSNISVMYILDSWASPQMMKLFSPLNEYIEKNPIENFDSIAKGMRESMTINGKIYAIPVRANASLMFYNEKILKDHGFEKAPQNFEEVISIAKAVSGRQEDGKRVYGLRFEVPTELINWARAWGGDTITSDFEIKLNEKPMIKVLQLARELYEAGAIPRDFMNLTADEYLTLMLNGQLAMTIRGANYYYTLTDPEKSNVAEDIKFIPVPASKTVDFDVTPVKTNFWAIAIPKASKNKENAWKFIKYLSSDKAALTMALNGNGPTKLTVLEDEQYMKETPYAIEAKKALNVGRPLWPAFTELPKVMDIFKEEVVMAVVGKKTPQEAMDDAAERIKPLLPKN